MEESQPIGWDSGPSGPGPGPGQFGQGEEEAGDEDDDEEEEEDFAAERCLTEGLAFKYCERNVLGEEGNFSKGALEELEPASPPAPLPPVVLGRTRSESLSKRLHDVTVHSTYDGYAYDASKHADADSVPGPVALDAPGSAAAVGVDYEHRHRKSPRGEHATSCSPLLAPVSPSRVPFAVEPLVLEPGVEAGQPDEDPLGLAALKLTHNNVDFINSIDEAGDGDGDGNGDGDGDGGQDGDGDGDGGQDADTDVSMPLSDAALREYWRGQLAEALDNIHPDEAQVQKIAEFVEHELHSQCRLAPDADANADADADADVDADVDVDADSLKSARTARREAYTHCLEQWKELLHSDSVRACVLDGDMTNARLLLLDATATDSEPEDQEFALQCEKFTSAAGEDDGGPPELLVG